MRGMLTLALVALLAQKPDVIRTKDGQARVGHIVDKTPAGYLFRDSTGETSVIAYDTVDDVSLGSDAPAVAPAPPPPVAIAPQPSIEQRATINRLYREISELRVDLEDATLVGPIVKYCIVPVALGFAAYLAWSGYDTSSRNLGSPTAAYVGAGVATGIAIGVAAWATIQLVLRLNTRATAPLQIAEKERELNALLRPR